MDDWQPALDGKRYDLDAAAESELPLWSSSALARQRRTREDRIRRTLLRMRDRDD